MKVTTPLEISNCMEEKLHRILQVVLFVMGDPLGYCGAGDCFHGPIGLVVCPE
jgi:hypothetical protein